MKRSEINAAIREMEQAVRAQGLYLPPFCAFTPEQWQTLGHEWDEVRRCGLGWDITDYGGGDFARLGFSLVTLRNGCADAPERYGKSYAEKLLYLRPGQYAPMHFHWHKTEDIIHRGGGRVLIRLYRAAPDESPDRTSPVAFSADGCLRTLPAGAQYALMPGGSITITPGLYHDFSLAEGAGPVLLGEVSQVNDDRTDNRFWPPMGRFPAVEEDEPPYRLLCGEYPAVR